MSFTFIIIMTILLLLTHTPEDDGDELDAFHQTY